MDYTAFACADSVRVHFRPDVEGAQWTDERALDHFCRESIALEDASAFFSSLESLATLRGTDEEVYERALEKITKSAWLHPSQLDTLKFSLAAQEATPRIQSAYEWYLGSVQEARDCESWILMHERTACSVEQLQELQASGSSESTFLFVSSSVNFTVHSEAY